MTREEKNVLFPLILDTLITKPLYCDTEDNLWKDIQMHLKNEGIAIKHLKEQFQEAVDVAKDLGILRVEGNAVRMPRVPKMDDMVAPSTSRRATTNRQPSKASRRRAPNRSKSPSRSRSGSRAHARSRSNARNKRKSR